MVVLTKTFGHEKQELLLTETFDYSGFFYHVTNQKFGKKGKSSIKMTKA
jgi:hypothetical protein